MFRDLPDLEPDESKLAVLAQTRLRDLKKKFEDALPETHIIRLK